MKKIILGLALLGSLAFGITFSKEQVKQFEQNCEAGDFEACSYAGALYKNPTLFGGNASDRDYKKALYYFKKACDGNDYVACSDLGAMYHGGKEVKKDYKKAVELFDKACDGGYADGCNAGSWMACGNFASVLEAGGDRARATQYYQKACEMGKKHPGLFGYDKDSLREYCDKYDILK